MATSQKRAGTVGGNGGSDGNGGDKGQKPGDSGHYAETGEIAKKEGRGVVEETAAKLREEVEMGERGPSTEFLAAIEAGTMSQAAAAKTTE